MCNFCTTSVAKPNCKTNDCIQTGLTRAICHWSVKQIVMPQTHTIGCASVAMLG